MNAETTLGAIVDAMGDLRVNRVTTEHLDQYRADRAGGRAPRQRRIAKATSLRKTFAILSAFFEDCREAGLIQVNPCRGVILPRPDLTSVHVPRPEDVDRLVAVAATGPGTKKFRGVIYADVIHVAFLTGLRVAEIAGLRNRAFVDVPGRPALVVPQPKVQREKRVPILLDAAIILRRHARPGDPDGPLFRSRTGGFLSPHSISRRFLGIRKRAGISARTTFHALRHAFAMQLTEAGADLGTVGALLGHAPPYSSTAIYVQHTSEDHMRQALARSFGRAKVPPKAPTVELGVS